MLNQRKLITSTILSAILLRRSLDDSQLGCLGSDAGRTRAWVASLLLRVRASQSKRRVRLLAPHLSPLPLARGEAELSMNKEQVG
jgi:hypothetical protein